LQRLILRTLLCKLSLGLCPLILDLLCFLGTVFLELALACV
jgi:hypothetical protein